MVDTSFTKLLKIKILIAKFKNVHMQKNESFSNFYVILSDIINSMFNIREKIRKYKVVRNAMTLVE